MSPRKFYEKHSKKEIKALAERAGTTFENFRCIACYNGSCSAKLAKKLSEASGGKMSVVEILYPDGRE